MRKGVTTTNLDQTRQTDRSRNEDRTEKKCPDMVTESLCMNRSRHGKRSTIKTSPKLCGSLGRKL